MFSPTAILSAIMLCAAMAAAEQAVLSEREAESRFVQAREMLEDRTIQDVSEVPAILEECARAGYVPAKLLLLDVYEGKRKGIGAAPEKAYKLACAMSVEELPSHAAPERKAAQLEATYRRAIYLERGVGGAPTAAEAYEWMRKAGMKELYKAQVECARYLISGVGHRRDYKSALTILRMVDKQAADTPNLYFYLGHMYLNGLGMRRPDTAMAKYYFEKGAARRDARAINNLAAIYERGIGIPRDSAMALRLYKRAADLGCKDASANLQRLAFKTDTAQRPTATWSQRIGNAGVRVLRAMPLEPELRRHAEEPLLRMSSGL